jgi:hypothetical protein
MKTSNVRCKNPKFRCVDDDAHDALMLLVIGEVLQRRHTLPLSLKLAGRYDGASNFAAIAYETGANGHFVIASNANQ